MPNQFNCPECGKFVMRTEQDALICPDGHGRVLGWCGSSEYADEKHKHDAKKWLAKFPAAIKQDRGWKIDGIDGLWKRRSPDGRETSRLDIGEAAPDGMRAAKVEFDVFAFVPLKDKKVKA